VRAVIALDAEACVRTLAKFAGGRRASFDASLR